MNLFRALGFADIVEPCDNTGTTRVGYVRVWSCRGLYYTERDAAPHVRGRSTYSAQTTDGWWVNVTQGIVRGWSDKAIHPAVTATRWRVRGPGP